MTPTRFPRLAPARYLRRAILVVAGALLPALALGQDLPLAAPVNPAFIAGPLAAPQGVAIARQALGAGVHAGFVPSPLDRSHMIGSLPAPLERALVAKAAVAGFPATFDLRSQGRVTPVKNQGACGDCWSFSTIASVESNILAAGGSVADLSENHQNVRHGFAIAPCMGGNGDIAGAYQTRWGNGDGYAAGLVYEADDPYTANAATSVAGLAPRLHLQEFLVLPGRTGPTDNDNYKFALLNYGAVDIAFYADGGMASSTNSLYWNQSTKAYYYSGGAAQNHEVALVGWDDNYAAASFSTRPPGNGAFLVRNSWGSGWGNAGYFWISYFDARLAGGHVFRKPESADNYRRAYLYDPLGQTSALGYGSAVAYGASVFTATATESLRAVAFNTSTVNSGYEISVYTDVASSPATGALDGGAVNTTGTIAYAGYHTITLARPVALVAGRKFAVVVRFTTPGYNYPVPVEYPYAGYANTVAAPGQSYVSANGATWTDLAVAHPNANANIRAFTGLPATATALASSANPSVAHQPVTFTATVTSAAGTPAGSVTFTDGTTTLCAAVALAPVGGAMQAHCTTTALAAAAHAIGAAYSGSAAHSASAGSLAQTVTAVPAATTTTLATSANPALAGQGVTFVATVKSATATPTGTVLFKDGATTICAASVVVDGVAARASCTVATLTVGTHTIGASYGGATGYAASATTIVQTVAAPKAATATALASSASPSAIGKPVTLTATVSAGSGSPTGSVTFRDGSTTACTAALVVTSGKARASCVTGKLGAGTHAFTAAYAGDAAYLPSASPALAQVVR